MASAYLLLNVETGTEEEVIKSLRDIQAVKEARMVYGVYDVVAKVKADTMDKLKEVVTWKLRRVENVKDSLTMIVIEGQK